ncbi:MAG: HlyD family type I secretion periplasmic adaptor subunit [Rhizobiales bacterium]|nr:HlyD family type I secretion periplasmic adaptor subunit [Hyphomicrobiales bacterium]
MSKHDLTSLKRSLNHHLWAGCLLAGLLIGGIGGWATFASLQSAVIAPGTVVVQSNKQQVQHQDGGIIAKINVKEGDHVSVGQVLFRLDGAQLNAEQGATSKRITELEIRKHRLVAERDNAVKLAELSLNSLTVDDELLAHAKSVQDVQLKRFEKRKMVLEGRKKQLKERIIQLGQEVDGLEHIIKSKTKQLTILDKEIKALKRLKKRDLVPMSRFNTMEREKLSVKGEIGRLQADIAKARGKIAETKLQLLEQDDNFEAEALKELETVDGELAQLIEKRTAIEDKLKRLDIRSPSAGRIHELAVHTVGGVIRSGDTLLSVIPEKDELVIDARIPPFQRDRVGSDMSARIRFTAFNTRNTPELLGKVTWVSPDQTVVSETQEPFFKIRIVLNENEEKRLKGKTIKPGMPAEVMITSHERTVMSYLVKPFADQLKRAFRER